MSDSDALSLVELSIGVLIVVAMLMRAWLGRLGTPAIVGFILIGLGVRVLDDMFGLVSDAGTHILEFLASTGLFILLFRVGLDSNFDGLVAKLPKAAPIWVGNVALSGIPGYFVCERLLGLAPIPSLFVAIALTATSLAVSAEMWREADALDSDEGETLIDVAELDDLSGVVLMAIVLAIAPALHLANGADVAMLTLEVGTGSIQHRWGLGPASVRSSWSSRSLARSWERGSRRRSA